MLYDRVEVCFTEKPRLCCARCPSHLLLHLRFDAEVFCDKHDLNDQCQQDFISSVTGFPARSSALPSLSAYCYAALLLSQSCAFWSRGLRNWCQMWPASQVQPVIEPFHVFIPSLEQPSNYQVARKLHPRAIVVHLVTVQTPNESVLAFTGCGDVAASIFFVQRTAAGMLGHPPTRSHPARSHPAFPWVHLFALVCGACCASGQRILHAIPIELRVRLLARLTDPDIPGSPLLETTIVHSQSIQKSCGSRTHAFSSITFNSGAAGN